MTHKTDLVFAVKIVRKTEASAGYPLFHHLPTIHFVHSALTACN